MTLKGIFEEIGSYPPDYYYFQYLFPHQANLVTVFKNLDFLYSPLALRRKPSDTNTVSSKSRKRPVGTKSGPLKC